VYQNSQLRISRAFSDMPYSDMVVAIMQDTFGVAVNACPTLGNRNIIVPNWNPMYTVSWLAKRSSAEVMQKPVTMSSLKV
jgi:hypothetical protein